MQSRSKTVDSKACKKTRRANIYQVWRLTSCFRTESRSDFHRRLRSTRFRSLRTVTESLDVAWRAHSNTSDPRSILSYGYIYIHWSRSSISASRDDTPLFRTQQTSPLQSKLFAYPLATPTGAAAASSSASVRASSTLSHLVAE